MYTHKAMIAHWKQHAASSYCTMHILPPLVVECREAAGHFSPVLVSVSIFQGDSAFTLKCVYTCMLCTWMNDCIWLLSAPKRCLSRDKWIRASMIYWGICITKYIVSAFLKYRYGAITHVKSARKTNKLLAPDIFWSTFDFEFIANIYYPYWRGQPMDTCQTSFSIHCGWISFQLPTKWV